MKKVIFVLVTIFSLIGELFIIIFPSLCYRWIWIFVNPADFWQKGLMIIIYGFFVLPFQIWFFVIGFTLLVTTIANFLDKYKRIILGKKHG